MFVNTLSKTHSFKTYPTLSSFLHLFKNFTSKFATKISSKWSRIIYNNIKWFRTYTTIVSFKEFQKTFIFLKKHIITVVILLLFILLDRLIERRKLQELWGNKRNDFIYLFIFLTKEVRKTIWIFICMEITVLRVWTHIHKSPSSQRARNLLTRSLMYSTLKYVLDNEAKTRTYRM